MLPSSIIRKGVDSEINEPEYEFSYGEIAEVRAAWLNYKDENGINGDNENVENIIAFAESIKDVYPSASEQKAVIDMIEIEEQCLMEEERDYSDSIVLNPFNINGTVSTYFELQNGDILEISQADPDGDFQPETPKEKEAFENEMCYHAVIYDRYALQDALMTDLVEISDAIYDSDTFFSNSLKDCGLVFTGNHALKENAEPIVGFGIEDAAMRYGVIDGPELDDVLANADEIASSQDYDKNEVSNDEPEL